jgi:DNA-binding phage protein
VPIITTKTKDVSADVKARGKALRAKLSNKPSIEELLTPDEIANATPFYFSLRSFVQQLKEARERLGLTLAQVAEKSGMAEESLCRLETGKAGNPSFQTLAKYAAAVGVRLHLSADDASR